MKTRTPPLVCGTIIGIWAALSEAIFAPIPLSPLSYAISIAGNPRDLLNWVVNHIFGTDLLIGSISLEFPVLTVAGIVLGSMVAAMWTKEFELKLAKEPLDMFMIGFLVAQSVSMLGACPIKAVVFANYGNLMALIGLTSIIIGVILACEFVKWRARK